MDLLDQEMSNLFDSAKNEVQKAYSIINRHKARNHTLLKI